MDKLKQFRAYIEKIITEYMEKSATDDDIEVELVIDRERDHYQLVNVGWRGENRVYGNVVHIDIKNEKIWIQFDGTECGIANKLLEAGISKKDIVLGFHSPFKRKFTDYAVQ